MDCIHHWVIELHQDAALRWTLNNIPRSQRKFNSVCKKCNGTRTFKPSTYEINEGNITGLRGIKGVSAFK